MNPVDFDAFVELLEKNDIVGAKAMIDTGNVLSTDRKGDGIVAILCWDGPDDPELLRHFVALGAPLEIQKNMRSFRISSLHYAAAQNKPKLIRSLLDIAGADCVNVLDPYGRTPLRQSFNSAFVECGKVLIDAGADLFIVGSMYRREWVSEFVASREEARSASVVVLGLLRCSGAHKSLCGNGKDVIRIVARCIWSTRGHNGWKK